MTVVFFPSKTATSFKFINFYFVFFLQTYTFHDEHSAPFGFRSRSQQDLSFEAGALPPHPPGDGGEEDGGDSGLEAVAAAPSKILTR